MKISAHHPFRSERARQRYLAVYDRVAEKWPVASETRTVETSHGQTFLRISGPVDASPMVLLPGIGNNSLMWTSLVEGLSEIARVHALDNIYDYGRSVYTRPIRSADDFTRWLDELFDALGLDTDITLMGASYGAWITSQYALRFPGRLRRIVLLVPAGTVVPLTFGFVVRALLCLIPLRYFTKRMIHSMVVDPEKKDERLRPTLEDGVDLAFTGNRCFKGKALVAPTVLSDEELGGLEIPALCLLGEKEIFYSAQKALERLAAVAPRIRAEIVPGTGHLLFLEEAELVIRKVREFHQEP